MTKKAKILSVICGFVILTVAVCVGYYILKFTKSENGRMNIEFIKTADDADCTLICDDEIAILIDTGEKCDSDAILQKLAEYKVEKLDYLIISHGDKDHVGSARVILDSTRVEKMIVPDYEDDEIEELIAYAGEKQIPVINPAQNEKIVVGDIIISCFPAKEKQYKKENNYSLVVLITHRDVDMLFAGDAVKKRSKELEQLEWNGIELYKVPHHGRLNDESENLFRLVNPKIAIVTSGSCDEAIINCAKECNSELYFTVPDGVSFVSDGESINRVSY